MSKAVNAALISGLTKELQGVDSCVVVGTSAMSVIEVTDFRNRLREKDFRMRVVKNALARVAFRETPLEGLDQVFNGPSAVIYGGEGAISIAKALVEEKKKAKDKLVFHGAINEGEVVDAGGVEALSKVPGRHELLSMCLAGLFGPVNEMSRNIEGLFTEMEGLIQALVEKHGDSGVAETVPA